MQKIVQLFNRFSISQRIIWPLSLFITVFLGIALVIEKSNLNNLVSNLTEDQATILVEYLADTSREALLNFDLDSLENAATIGTRSQNIAYIQFIDSEGNKSPAKLEVNASNSNIKEYKKEILDNSNNKLGEVVLGFDSTFSQDAIAEATLILFMEFAVLLSLIILMVHLLLRVTLKPMKDFRNEMQISAKENNQTGEKLMSMSSRLSSISTEQSSAIQETVASMSEIKAMVFQTQGNLKACESDTKNVQTLVNQGNEVMDDLNESVNGIRLANSNLESLVDVIGEIREKTGVINEIVNKTQLLSFNASIEAVRAGEHGLGFSLVAQEVAKLAESSGEAAQVRETLVRDSQSNVNDMLTTLNARVEQGDKVTESATQIFKEVSEAVDNVSNKILQISEATSEQKLGIEQSAIAMERLSSTAIENQDSAGLLLDLSQKNQQDWDRISHAIESVIKGQKSNHSQKITKLEEIPSELMEQLKAHLQSSIENPGDANADDVLEGLVEKHQARQSNFKKSA